jgi:hypothetical protein
VLTDRFVLGLRHLHEVVALEVDALADPLAHRLSLMPSQGSEEEVAGTPHDIGGCFRQQGTGTRRTQSSGRREILHPSKKNDIYRRATPGRQSRARPHDCARQNAVACRSRH